MKERVIKGFKGDNLSPEQVTFGTFHSVFFGILKEFLGYSSENIIKEWEKEGGIGIQFSTDLTKNKGFYIIKAQNQLTN